MSEQIEFTPEKAKRLKKAYEAAVKENKNSFIFEGNEFVTGYAKYVLEYLAMRKILKSMKTG